MLKEINNNLKKDMMKTEEKQKENKLQYKILEKEEAMKQKKNINKEYKIKLC